MLGFTFKWSADKTEYTFTMSPDSKGGKVSFYDCGHEYATEYTEEEVVEKLDSGEWHSVQAFYHPISDSPYDDIINASDYFAAKGERV